MSYPRHWEGSSVAPAFSQYSVPCSKVSGSSYCLLSVTGLQMFLPFAPLFPAAHPSEALKLPVAFWSALFPQLQLLSRAGCPILRGQANLLRVVRRGGQNPLIEVQGEEGPGPKFRMVSDLGWLGTHQGGMGLCGGTCKHGMGACGEGGQAAGRVTQGVGTKWGKQQRWGRHRGRGGIWQGGRHHGGKRHCFPNLLPSVPLPSPPLTLMLLLSPQQQWKGQNLWWLSKN